MADGGGEGYHKERMDGRRKVRMYKEENTRRRGRFEEEGRNGVERARGDRVGEKMVVLGKFWRGVGK